MRWWGFDGMRKVEWGNWNDEGGRWKVEGGMKEREADGKKL